MMMQMKCHRTFLLLILLVFRCFFLRNVLPRSVGSVSNSSVCFHTVLNKLGSKSTVNLQSDDDGITGPIKTVNLNYAYRLKHLLFVRRPSQPSHWKNDFQNKNNYNEHITPYTSRLISKAFPTHFHIFHIILFAWLLFFCCFVLFFCLYLFFPGCYQNVHLQYVRALVCTYAHT